MTSYPFSSNQHGSCRCDRNCICDDFDEKEVHVMEKKSFTTLMKFHLILLCVLILSRAFNAFMIFSGNVISEAKDWFSPSEAGFSVPST